MRNQIKAVYTIGNTAELGAAVGLQGANNSFKDTGTELSRVPTFAVRGALLAGKSKVGISALYTELKFDPALPTARRTGAGGGLLYADFKIGEGTQIKGEAYIGRNMNNLGMLALGFGSVAHDIDEAGGFVSARQQLTEVHAVYATAGLAQILNPSEVSPDYSVTPGATATAAATRALTAAGPGMKVNMTARIGYEYRPVKPLAFVLEGFIYRSRHVFQAVDFGRFDPMRIAPGLEFAAMYSL